MMRVYSAKIVNYFLSHPDIAPQYLREGQEIPQIEDEHLHLEQVLAYLLDNTLFLFYDQGSNTYEGEVYALPYDRGKKVISLTKEMVNYLFKNGVDKLIAEILITNKPAQILQTRLGSKRTGIKDDKIIYELVRG